MPMAWIGAMGFVISILFAIVVTIFILRLIIFIDLKNIEAEKKRNAKCM